jgi:hypothetical protein
MSNGVFIRKANCATKELSNLDDFGWAGCVGRLAGHEQRRLKEKKQTMTFQSGGR